MKKTDLYTKVRMLLTIYPDARDDDFILYYRYCKQFTDAPVWAMSFEEAMLNHFEHDLPKYEAITRTRRRVQEECEELRGEHYTRRKERQEEYREEYRR